MNTMTERPAETLTVAAAIAALVTAIFGIADPQVYQALIVLIGALPALVTFVVQLVRGQKAGG